jgi:hypothetical protein|tara:strand:- start:857 stop:1201 length:345 start_codon:yes stop_codon:yes gene_type:complete
MPRAVTISTRPLESKTLYTYTVTKDNVTAMSKKLGILIRTHKNSRLSNECLANELLQLLNKVEDLVNGGDDRKNFGNCKCTHPPSMGFCVQGMCVWGSMNLSKLEGSLSITINF